MDLLTIDYNSSLSTNNKIYPRLKQLMDPQIIYLRNSGKHLEYLILCQAI